MAAMCRQTLPRLCLRVRVRSANWHRLPPLEIKVKQRSIYRNEAKRKFDLISGQAQWLAASNNSNTNYKTDETNKNCCTLKLQKFAPFFGHSSIWFCFTVTPLLVLLFLLLFLLVQRLLLILFLLLCLNPTRQTPLLRQPAFLHQESQHRL